MATNGLTDNDRREIPKDLASSERLHAAEELSQIMETIRTDFDVQFDPLHVDGRTLQVLSICNMQTYIDKLIGHKAVHNPLKDLPLWAKIWPGSFVLGRFLRKYEPDGKTLLELGAGCGVLSMIAAGYGFSRIVLTEKVKEALLFAKANVLRNELQDIIDVAYLDITTPGKNSRYAQGFDRIAASEILYLDELHRPLIKFIQRHLAPGGKAFFCTDMARNKPSFATLAAKHFKVTEGHIGVKAHDDENKEQRRIYSILILEQA